jgi:hypothetical protein
MKVTIYKWFLALSTLEGAIALFFMFRVQSMDSSVWLFGYSARWLAIGLLATILVLFSAGLTLIAFRNEPKLERIVLRLDKWLSEDDRLLVLTLVFSAIFLLAISSLLLWQIPAVHNYYWYKSFFKRSFHLYETLLVIFGRLVPLLAWATAILLQSLVLLAIRFSNKYRKPGFWNRQVISRTTLVIAMLSLSLIHWLVLALIEIQAYLPGWFWEYDRRPFSLRHAFFLVILAISLGLVAYIIRHPKRVALSLISLIVLGYLIQVSFGFIRGQGYESIRLKYAGTKHRAYAEIAAADFRDPLGAVRQYEQRYGGEIFPSTKPPGVVLFYILMENFVNLIRPEQTAEGRFLVLTRFIAYVFPLVSFLVLRAIYRFVKPLVRETSAIIPSILYIFIPNIILIPLYLDQVIYPLLFMLGILLMRWVLKKNSFFLAAIAGACFYVAIFFSFSLAPLLPFFVILIALEFMLNRRERNWLQPVRLFLGLGLGILAMFIFFRVVLNYDIFERYATVNRVVRNFDFILRTGGKLTEDLATTAVSPSPRQILRASLLNNLDFAAALGFPIFLLFLWRAGRTLLALIRRRGSDLEVYLGALFLTYLALNLYGQIQGEAARIWMFWVPVVVIFAGIELASSFQRRDLALYLVITLQLVTMLVTFQFQDFIWLA